MWVHRPHGNLQSEISCQIGVARAPTTSYQYTSTISHQPVHQPPNPTTARHTWQELLLSSDTDGFAERKPPSTTTTHHPPDRYPLVGPFPPVGPSHRLVRMEKDGGRAADLKDPPHDLPGKYSTSPATVFPPTASVTSKVVFTGSPGGPEWSLHGNSIGMPGELHGPESSVPAVSTLQLASSSTLSQRMAAAKPLLWKGRGELPQLPWQRPCQGLVLVIDLWSGLGGTLIALLALGIRCIALSAEMDVNLHRALASAFPNLSWSKTSS